MRENLEKIINNSYCPYSNLRTACIVKMNNGQEFIGVNVENASFKNGLCSEQVAIAAAIAEGYSKADFEELHIYSESNKFSYPCFLCRQLLLEFFGLDKFIYVYKKDGKFLKLSLKELCPYPFDYEEVHDGQ